MRCLGSTTSHYDAGLMCPAPAISLSSNVAKSFMAVHVVPSKDSSDEYEL